MSGYTPKTNRNAYITWDSAVHEDILVAFLRHYWPGKDGLEEIHRNVQEMGYAFSVSAMRLVFYYDTLRLSNHNRALPLHCDLHRKGLQQHWGSFLIFALPFFEGSQTVEFNVPFSGTFPFDELRVS
ncbi:hypothetical protein PG997_000607 [Apiospora hydei]|uniref:Uncharacterized protein n=1 Tax=Apiospora hydei TaxID=1337664 RepID=A0ABR1XBD4_9PEZI